MRQTKPYPKRRIPAAAKTACQVKKVRFVFLWGAVFLVGCGARSASVGTLDLSNPETTADLMDKNVTDARARIETQKPPSLPNRHDTAARLQHIEMLIAAGDLESAVFEIDSLPAPEDTEKAVSARARLMLSAAMYRETRGLILTYLGKTEPEGELRLLLADAECGLGRIEAAAVLTESGCPEELPGRNSEEREVP